MEYGKTSFVYSHICLTPKFFLGRSHQMILQMCLGVVVFQTCLFHAKTHSAFTTLYVNFSCHTPGITHTTTQLRLRRDWPMPAAADFEPSDMLFNIRWST